MVESFSIEVGGRRHSSSLRPGARRHAPRITIGSVYELRYAPIVGSGFVVTKFLQFAELRWIARERAVPVSQIALKSATSAVWRSIV
jgi:hypothetical protein